MKKQNTLVSILIINFNNAKFLKRSIRSCINQTYKNIEILVYDDKSTDNSLEILKDFKKKDINLGNWNSIINKFDIYKDGKTNIRIMSFINNFFK